MNTSAGSLPAPRRLRSPLRSPKTVARVAADFEALFLAEYPAVVAVAARVLQERQAAEDVAQEVFLDFHVRFPKGREGAGGWLRLASAHLALNRLRSERRRSGRERGQAHEEVPGASPEAQVLAHEAQDVVRRALGRIRPHQASLLMLRYSGLSYAEVALALNLPVNQVGARLRRAERALRQEVEHEDRAASR
ncbi:MAG: sigma-70 family RNA polymerase sigma factor [Candidatus Dormibacteria bacterium]